MARILITGGAGFLGYHIANALGQRHEVLVIDRLRAAYGSDLCEYRLSHFTSDVAFEQSDLIIDFQKRLESRVSDVDLVIHLAALAGVRTSLEQSSDYLFNNTIASANVLRACQRSQTPLLLASSSSVYGDKGSELRCREDDADGSNLRSPYAASKWMTEIWIQSLSALIPPTVVVRPFSLYGPLGRPDMAYYSFASSMLQGKPIRVFGDLERRRDLTYISDAVFYLEKIADGLLANPHETVDHFRTLSGVAVANICNGNPISLRELLRHLEEELQITPDITWNPESPLDVSTTFGDPSRLHEFCGTQKTQLSDGIAHFASWLREYQASDSAA